jgi:integrase
MNSTTIATPTKKPIPRGIQVVQRTNLDGTKITKYRVQIKRKNFELDKLFDDLDEAIETRQASLSFTGKNQIKLLEEQKKKEQAIIADWFLNEPLENYYREYLVTYIEPKFEMYDPKTAEGKFKLRNLKNIKSFFKTILNTKIKVQPKEEDTYGLSPKIFSNLMENKKFGSFKPVDITEIEMNEYIKERLKTGVKPISIQREITHISNLFNKLKYLDTRLKKVRNPTKDYDKDLLLQHGPLLKAKRTRLSDDDHEKLFNLIDSYGNPELGQIIKLSLLTSMRRSEVVLLKWDQIEENHIRLVRTKTDDERIVFLTLQAREFIKTIAKRKNDPRLFTYTVLGFQGSFDKLLENNGLQHIKFNGFRKESISNFISEIGANNSLLIAEFLGIKHIKKLEDTHIKEHKIIEGLSSQDDVLSSVGHKSTRTTGKHYFSLKKTKKSS